MKNILGLDLGTNSIGWALVQYNEEKSKMSDIKLGSRIIPMSQDVIDKFGNGVTESQAAVRTAYRGARRLRERYLLRRERLLRLFHVLGFLPQHFDQSIGWSRDDNKTYGKFIAGEPKLAYVPTDQGKQTFMFRTSFEEMLAEFSRKHPDLTKDCKKIPYDWTLYYLRKKALIAPISKYELAWIILRFNQKRGYYQLRGEEEITEGKKKEYAVLTVANVEETNEKRKGNTVYHITFTNGMCYDASSRTPMFDLIGKEVEYIITIDLDENGEPKRDKDGNIKPPSFRKPDENDWTLKKKRTETFIDESSKTVGEYIYDCLLEKPDTKINGGYVQTIERRYYRSELKRILEKQSEYIPELRDQVLLEECIKELYHSNTKRQESLKAKGMINLILEDTLFYQRPLKTKKSEIADCPHETYQRINKQTGEVISPCPVKCIAKSNPYFQEFRLWQFVWNLRLYSNTGINEDNVTDQYLCDAKSREELFLWLNNKKQVKQEELLAHLGIKKSRGAAALPVRWNYVADKEYPCNETRADILKYLKKAQIDSSLIDDSDILYNLWHILYSVEVKDEAYKALRTFATKHNLSEDFVTAFASFPQIKKDYGAFSEKAIKKLLPLLRDGMQLWQAEEAIYGKKTNTDKWNTPSDMKAYIDAFPVGSLRNPIVEQCILESLRTVHAIWQQCGHIDEIHVELGREMKNPADKRKKMTERIQQNENTNMRIKTLLAEFKKDSLIAGVRPNSPMQQDILRIYEEGALQTLSKNDPDFNDIYRISRLANPTASEITRYKLWMEQRYRSPYTGKPIPLSRLFTSDYEIEHIIPRSRFFDDSFNNKVICESEVNRLKGNMLGMEFIKAKGGMIVETTHGTVEVFGEAQYTQFIEDFYKSNKNKGRNLKLEDIPEEFVQRQMNDSRYISRVVKSMLSAIVREEGEEEETSKNIIVCSGGITTKLKADWGLNDVWNSLVYPRFERMNQLTGSNAFGQWENKGGKRVFQTNMPLELSAGYSKKRIDHRHHAMDALVIACATRNIINYLNNVSARDPKGREDLKHKLISNGLLIKPWETFTQDARQALSSVIVSFKNTVRVLSSTVNLYEHYDENGKKVRTRQEGNNVAVRKPLHKETFYGHVNLKRIKSVSINDAIKHPEDIRDREIRKYIMGLYASKFTEQQIKKFLKQNDYHYNRKDLRKVEVYYMTDEVEPLVATRKPLDETFDKKKIETITDSGIQKILLNYLESQGGDPKVAFTPEGIRYMNDNITQYNGGKDHKPIVKVRVTETKGVKFPVGLTGNKKYKYVEANSGTNLYFAIYKNEDDIREYRTIPLIEVIERLKQNMYPVPEKTENGALLCFSLSPNDLVYVPTEDEIQTPSLDSLDFDRVYKFVSANKKQAYFVPNRFANTIYSVKKNDASQYCNKTTILNEISIGNELSKTERIMNIDPYSQSHDGELVMIKAVCWKLETDRLGNITRIIR